MVKLYIAPNTTEGMVQNVVVLQGTIIIIEGEHYYSGEIYPESGVKLKNKINKTGRDWNIPV